MSSSNVARKLPKKMNAYTESLPSVQRRLLAGKMLLDGATLHEVAYQLHLSMPTARRYQTLIKHGGMEALRALGVGGRTSSVDQETRDWISAALQTSAMKYGFENDEWTNARLRALIENRIGIRFSRVYVWQIATNLGLAHRLSKPRD
jgi:transposase